MISETQAWDILSEYVADCLRIDTDSLIAIYAIGSLGGSYYRPGQSDIDAVLIVRDSSEDSWGTPIKASRPLAALNRRYLEAYQISKDFGPFAIPESKLFPPYLPEDELVPEIARLKLQGKPVFGSYDLEGVPMPSADDVVAHTRHFETWFETEFLKEHPFDTFSARACTNTILMHMSRFLWIKQGIIEFDKREVVARYLASDPPFVNEDMFRLVARSLAGHELSEREADHLRLYTGSVRREMNGMLHQRIPSTGGKTTCQTRFA